MNELTVNLKISISEEDIDDIMTTALEGGITYWCRKAKVEGEYLGEYASEQIARGGVLKLYPVDEDKTYTLTLEKLLKGIEQAMQEQYFPNYERWSVDGIDTCNVDADVADVIIQFALFGEIVYG